MSGFFLRISGFALFDCTAHLLKFYRCARRGAKRVELFPAPAKPRTIGAKKSRIAGYTRT